MLESSASSFHCITLNFENIEGQVLHRALECTMQDLTPKVAFSVHSDWRYSLIISSVHSMYFENKLVKPEILGSFTFSAKLIASFTS